MSISTKGGIGSRASDEDSRTAVRVGMYSFPFFTPRRQNCISKKTCNSLHPPGHKMPAWSKLTRLFPV